MCGSHAMISQYNARFGTLDAGTRAQDGELIGGYSPGRA